MVNPQLSMRKLLRDSQRKKKHYHYYQQNNQIFSFKPALGNFSGTGIWPKIRLGMGFGPNLGWGKGFIPPPPPPPPFRTLLQLTMHGNDKTRSGTFTPKKHWDDLPFFTEQFSIASFIASLQLTSTALVFSSCKWRENTQTFPVDYKQRQQ